MAPRIDERYHFLAAEEKWGLVSDWFSAAFSVRPNAKKLDKDRYLSVYGYDIITLAMLSDSPLNHPLSNNFDETLIGVWRFLNKIWIMRLSYDCDNIVLPEIELNDGFEYYIKTEQLNKIVAAIHTKAKLLAKSFNDTDFLELLSLMKYFVPNFVEDVIFFLKNNK